jgi:hypothetical protein
MKTSAISLINELIFNVKPGNLNQEGAYIQSHNNEIVKQLELLKENRDTINKEISSLEQEKLKISTQIKSLTEQQAIISGTK